MKILDMEVPSSNPREIWIEEQKENLQKVEYNYPYPCANAVALIELNKLSEAFSLNLDVPSTALTYHQPVCERATFFPDLIKDSFLLLLSKLRDINLICFPDWDQPEESLCSNIEKLISSILAHPDRSRITLLIYRSNISEEDANLVLAGATMNVFLEEKLEVDDEPEFHLMENLSQVQWAALIPRLCSEIIFDDSNKQPSAKLASKNIPICELESFSKQRIVQLETGAFVLR
jgi:hypothetical protein